MVEGDTPKCVAIALQLNPEVNIPMALSRWTLESRGILASEVPAVKSVAFFTQGLPLSHEVLFRVLS